MKSKPGDWHISSLAHIPELLALHCAEHFSHLNYVHFVPLKSRTSASYGTAYRSASKFFSSLSHPLTHFQIDNEISADLTPFFQAAQPPIHYQRVPPNNHRADKAERSIRTGNNHFLSSPLPTSTFPLIAGVTFSPPPN